MEAPRILELLDIEFAEKTLDREHLGERLELLDDDIEKLSSQREVMQAVLERFADHDDNALSADVLDDVASDDDDIASGDSHRIEGTGTGDGVLVSWPVGPHYKKAVSGKGRLAWPRYKLKSADWYLATLQEILNGVPKLDRFLGIEMAIDGALGALCAAVEAGIAALTGAVEMAAAVPEAKRSPLQAANWSRLVAQARILGIQLTATSELSGAFSDERSDAPSGWFAQLQLLRDRSACHDTLLRRSSVFDAEPGVFLDVPGSGPQPPLAYLTGIRGLVDELVEALLSDVKDVSRRSEHKKDELAKTLRGSSRRELPDLLPRARVIPPA